MLQKRNLLITMPVILLIALLVVFGLSAAYAQGTTTPNCPYSSSMMGNQGMMGNGIMGQQYSSGQCTQFFNMMGSGMMGSMMNGQAGMLGMMGYGMMNGQFGPGTGMMGQWTPSAELRPSADKPLTLKTATTIAESYIAAWRSDHPLKLGDLMQFSNQFYGEALETDTQRGAFEFLIDPKTGTVYTEPGPNMMWNLRYGTAMWLPRNYNDAITLTVSPDKAREYAQAFLDDKFPGTKAEDKFTTFYGYYTIDILKDNKPIGMLSVNGFTGQVWYHSWHGDFLSEIE